MVEVKDLILIGAVGAAGILGYKAIKGGLGSLELPQKETIVDYDVVEKITETLNTNQSAIAQLLQNIAANPGGGTVNNYYTIEGGSSGDLTQKDLAQLADAATFALEKTGAYGSIRESQALVTEGYDKSQQSLSQYGLASATTPVVEAVADAVGLPPSLTGAVGAAAAALNPISSAAGTPGSTISTSNVFVGIADWLGLRSKKSDPEPEPTQTLAAPAPAGDTISMEKLGQIEATAGKMAAQRLAAKYGISYRYL